MQFADLPIKDIIDMTQKICTGGASLVAAYIGIKGYGRWFLEHRGKEKFEAAKSVVAGCYRLRDQMDAVRGGTLYATQFWVVRPQNRQPDEPPLPRDLHSAYRERLKGVTQALADLHPALIEAEALFGPEARRTTDGFTDYARKLHFAIDTYFAAERDDAETAKSDPFFRKLRNITMGVHPGMNNSGEQAAWFYDDDRFTEGSQAALKAIEDFFKGPLTLHTSDPRHTESI